MQTLAPEIGTSDPLLKQDASPQPEILNIPLSEVRPMPHQPRSFVDQEKIRELAESIKAEGQAQAGKVRPIDPPDSQGHRWEIISGERRFRACLSAGIGFFRAEVDRRPMTPGEQYIAAITCNSDQEPLSATENAIAIQRLKGMGLSDDKICTVMSCALGWVNQYYNLLKLSPKVFAMMGPEIPEGDRLKSGVAQLLLAVPEEYQIALASDIVLRKLSMVQSRELIESTLRSRGVPTKKKRPNREFRSFAAFIERTHVQLNIYLNTPTPVLRTMLSGAAHLQERMKVMEKLQEIAVETPELSGQVEHLLKISEAEKVRLQYMILGSLIDMATKFPLLKEKLEEILRNRIATS